ncbi:MFS transporter [Rhizorhabdus wittichii]|uniref:MFS transporter n=1 Tax=Rhizorhabdus wittichii TaxID=160791 RepID=UPI0003600AA6|nr:MFS transporter [Rhizorhabdus wittichii]
MVSSDLDPRQTILQSPMTTFQIRSIAILFGLNAIDGFDLLSITYAAPGIVREWHLDPVSMGVILSAGLAGMALGSLFLAPLADRVGRRPITLASLSVITLGMLLASQAGSPAQLTAWRLLTGLGVGTIIPSFTALTAEYSNARRRNLIICIMGVGFPIGAIVGGVIAAMLLRFYDWRSVFLFGSISTAIFLPLVWCWMPESIAFLLVKRDASALNRVNRLLSRMGHAPVAVLPRADGTRGSPFAIFRGSMLPITMTIFAAYFLHSATYYYAFSWIPPIVADLGFSVSKAAQVSVLANVGGAAGGLAVGALSLRMPVQVIMVAMLFGAALMVIVFGGIPADITLMMIAGGVSIGPQN